MLHAKTGRTCALALAIGLVIFGSAVAAQDLCVVCTEPQATYRCVVTGANPQPQNRQLACITALAGQGGHATCSVRQPSAGTVCHGDVREVAAASAPPLKTTEPAPPDVAKGAAPETVEQAMRKVTSSAAKQMDKTNDQLKRGADNTTSFIQRSFSCLTSFFSRCGGN